MQLDIAGFLCLARAFQLFFAFSRGLSLNSLRLIRSFSLRALALALPLREVVNLFRIEPNPRAAPYAAQSPRPNQLVDSSTRYPYNLARFGDTNNRWHVTCYTSTPVDNSQFAAHRCIIQPSYEAKEYTMSKLARLRARLATDRKKVEATVGQFVGDTLEVGSGLAAGYTRGRFEDPANPDSYKVLGVDPELIVALPGKVLAYVGMAGKYSHYLHSLANGPLVFYGGLRGLEMGQEHRAQDSGTTGRTGHRQMAPGSGSRLADELRQRAQQAV
jgi:hypothetical protein